jgi:RND family efflux transporter MFP subunit
MLSPVARLMITLLTAAAWAATAKADSQSTGSETFQVHASQVEDFKSVYATVRSRDVVEARVRTGGTIATLNVDEGDEVEPGKVLALVTDPKLALRVKAIEAQIVAAKSRTETAQAELERAKQLAARGVTAQARVDQAQTAFDVATNDLKAAQAERAVVETQASEGEVLAPSSGRVLRVPVTVGSVVLMGESIATIAANEYLLRVEVPERHARFMKKGDVIRIGGRELESPGNNVTEGKITQVYPQLNNGRVIADAEAPGLGNYFVGERVLTWISAGERTAFVVPAQYVFRRYGLDYVRLATQAGSPQDVAVQLGRRVTGANGQKSIEILAGVADGDKLVQP